MFMEEKMKRKKLRTDEAHRRVTKSIADGIRNCLRNSKDKMTERGSEEPSEIQYRKLKRKQAEDVEEGAKASLRTRGERRREAEDSRDASYQVYQRTRRFFESWKSLKGQKQRCPKTQPSSSMGSVFETTCAVFETNIPFL